MVQGPKEILTESVVLDLTPGHDSQANPAERAIRTLEEQVKVLRLDFEKRTEAELLANSCLWPGLIRHAGWVDARFRVKTNGATPNQDAYDSTYSSELLPFGELVLFRTPLPHSRRTSQNRTRYRGDSGWDKGFWCGRLDEDNAHIVVTENGREIARTVRRLPLSRRVDASLLKLVKGLAWDGQGLVRRGGPLKLKLPEPSMAETGETLRTSGSSLSGTRSSPIRPGPTDVKADPETEWTPVARRRRFRSKTPDPAVVEATKKLRSTRPTSDTGNCTKMDLTDEETRKRALVETTGDDDEPAEKYRRDEDCVAKALMDELTGNWLTDENGILDEDAAGDTWTDCLGAGGEHGRQAAAEATEKALDSLLAHGGIQDSDDAMGQTLEDEGRRVEDEGQILWTRVQMGRAQRRLVFSWSDACLETFEADAVDAYFQAPEHEEVVVEPAPEYLERLAKAGRDTDIVWRWRRQLPGRRAAGQSWVEHVAGILVNKLGFERCTTAPQFHWSAVRLIALELHMDDIHGAATPSGREQVIRDLSREIEFKGGDRSERVKAIRTSQTTAITTDW